MFLKENFSEEVTQKTVELIRNTNSSVYKTPEEIKTSTLYLPDIRESTDLLLLPGQTR